MPVPISLEILAHMPEQPSGRPPTVGVYDRPAWWRTRRTRVLALAVVAALLASGVWYAILM